jgi:hypothetical protein
MDTCSVFKEKETQQQWNHFQGDLCLCVTHETGEGGGRHVAQGVTLYDTCHHNPVESHANPPGVTWLSMCCHMAAGRLDMCCAVAAAT